MRRIIHGAAWVIAYLTVTLALAMAGCASAGDVMRQAVADTAITVAVGYRTLGTVDKSVQEKIQALAPTDPHKADEALTAHLAKYKVARKVLDAAAALVETANATIPLIDKGLAKEKSPASWVADLIAVGLTVTSALATLGVM